MNALTPNAAAIPAPVGLLAELTHRCPLRCPYCSNPLDLDRRSRNCVLSTDAQTVGDLDDMTDGELIRIPNLGRKSLDEIRAAIAALQTRS